MRIQETDRILKDARTARLGRGEPHEQSGNVISRAWRAIVGAIKR